MGIKNLTKFIADHCPDAVKRVDIKGYSGCKVAIDASMWIYKFLIAIRQEGNTLVNDEQEPTSHLNGLFYKTLRLLDNGIKPIFVFDGKPPELKSHELSKRSERREEAGKLLEKAQEEEDVENIEKMSKRLVKISPQHTEDCKKLLDLMGIPFVTAPSEAEAQCSALVKSGKVFAVGTEDMDALTFGGTKLLRHLSESESKKQPIDEYHLNRILEVLHLSMAQFVDLCILLGCDYCHTIHGIGPKKAIDLIRKHGDIETVVANIDTNKYKVPENWNYQAARELFLNPEVSDSNEVEIKMRPPNEEGLIEFMCGKNKFSEERIRNGIARLNKSRGKATQIRIDSFFTAKPPSQSNGNIKRPLITNNGDDKKAAKKAKKEPATKKPAASSKGGKKGGK